MWKGGLEGAVEVKWGKWRREGAGKSGGKIWGGECFYTNAGAGGSGAREMGRDMGGIGAVLTHQESHVSPPRGALFQK